MSQEGHLKRSNEEIKAMEALNLRRMTFTARGYRHLGNGEDTGT